MNGSLMVVLPRGKAGEIFAQTMASEMSKPGSDNRVRFTYPYMPEYKDEGPALLQHVAAIVRDGLMEGITEFLFADTSIRPVLESINDMLPEGANPVIYDPVVEARDYFADPHARPVWLDRPDVAASGFTKINVDAALEEEVFWRCRGVLGGNVEHAPANFKANLTSEEFLRSRTAQLLFRLSEVDYSNGIVVGNIELAAALTRYIDEEFRDLLEAVRFVQLAKVLASRML